MDVFTDYIKVDQIAFYSEDNFIHFVTRPMVFRRFPDNWNSIIYTTPFIQEFFSKTEFMNIPQDRIKILEPGQPTVIHLIDSTDSITVTMFETEGLTRNCMMLMSDKSTTTLYTGEFMEYKSLMPRLREININNIIVDNTLDNVKFTHVNDAKKASKEIVKLVKMHPKQVILLLLPILGYEELLIELTNKNIKIRADPIRYLLLKKINKLHNILSEPSEDEQIVTKTAALLYKDIKDLHKTGKYVMLKIIQRNDKNILNTAEKQIGLYQINYSPHISYGDLQKFIKELSPNIVYSMHNYLSETDEAEIYGQLCRVPDDLPIIENEKNASTTNNNEEPDLLQLVLNDKNDSINQSIEDSMANIRPSQIKNISKTNKRKIHNHSLSKIIKKKTSEILYVSSSSSSNS